MRKGRGRPRKLIESENDRGTVELRIKRKSGATSEALDLCWKRRLIVKKEYIAGLHFRWLYVLRFGNPGISAYYIGKMPGYVRRYDDVWFEARNREYKEAVLWLKKIGAYSVVMNVCVFNLRPGFLSKNYCKSEVKKLEKLREALGSDVFKVR